ncbi:MAG: hypothetical protein IPG86_10045 [Chitinophagaceae bacterium]|nr:hypothetical protein [Chitinophagaceae bacterium]
MKSIYIMTAALLLFKTQTIHAQGCVAVRSNGNTSCALGTLHSKETKSWLFNLNTRYFRSYKHFVGDEEQKERVENGTEVINYSLSWDFTLTRQLNRFWSVALNAPIISNVRSSMYEHYGNNNTSPNARNKTRSFGLGDVRLSASRWLLDPLKHPKGNIQVGLGIKLATGDYQYQDYFHKPGAGGKDSTVLGPVDQSIQLGDGGTGLSIEINAYRTLGHKWSLYTNLYYMANPREQNGVSTSRGGATSATNIQYFTNTMSVPDQFMARAGANFMSGKFSFAAGARLEGIPSCDLIGGDKGFRRPGFIVSAEPVISYMNKKCNFYISTPVALVRNRTKSYADKLRSSATGTDIHGDAAFADYLVNAGVTVRF